MMQVEKAEAPQTDVNVPKSVLVDLSGLKSGTPTPTPPPPPPFSALYAPPSSGRKPKAYGPGKPKAVVAPPPKTGLAALFQGQSNVPQKKPLTLQDEMTKKLNAMTKKKNKEILAAGGVVQNISTAKTRLAEELVENEIEKQEVLREVFPILSKIPILKTALGALFNQEKKIRDAGENLEKKPVEKKAIPAPKIDLQEEIIKAQLARQVRNDAKGAFVDIFAAKSSALDSMNSNVPSDAQSAIIERVRVEAARSAIDVGEYAKENAKNEELNNDDEWDEAEAEAELLTQESIKEKVAAGRAAAAREDKSRNDAQKARDDEDRFNSKSSALDSGKIQKPSLQEIDAKRLAAQRAAEEADMINKSIASRRAAMNSKW